MINVLKKLIFIDFRNCWPPNSDRSVMIIFNRRVHFRDICETRATFQASGKRADSNKTVKDVCQRRGYDIGAEFKILCGNLIGAG